MIIANIALMLKTTETNSQVKLMPRASLHPSHPVDCLESSL